MVLERLHGNFSVKDCDKPFYEKRAAPTLAQSSASVREMFQNAILLGSVGSQFALNDVNGFYHNAIHAGSNCKYAFTFTADAEL